MEPRSVSIARHSLPDSRAAGLSTMAGSQTNLPEGRWQLRRRVQPDRGRPASCEDEHRARSAHPAGAPHSYSTVPRPARSASGRRHRTSRRSARQVGRSLRSLVNHTPTAARGRWEAPRTYCGETPRRRLGPSRITGPSREGKLPNSHQNDAGKPVRTDRGRNPAPGPSLRPWGAAARSSCPSGATHRGHRRLGMASGHAACSFGVNSASSATVTASAAGPAAAP
jgi:hypothetical protein